MSALSDSQAIQQVLADQVVEPLVRGAGSQHEFRVWVPACGTGEAAYALAVLFLDTFGSAGGDANGFRLQMFGTASVPEELAVARAGFYSASTAEQIAGNRLRKYFNEDPGQGFRARYRLRDMISFAVHDLSRDPPFARLDLVDARYALASVPASLHQHVLDILQFSLRPQGYLCLGPGAAVVPREDQFTAVSGAAGIFRKETGARVRYTAPPRGRLGAASAEHLAGGEDLQRRELVRKAILRTRVPPTLVVDGQGTVLFTHGELRPWVMFPQGDPHLELDGILNASLAPRVRSAVFSCRRDGKSVEVIASGGVDHGRTRVLMSAAPEIDPGAVVITFTADTSEPPSDDVAEADEGRAASASPWTAELERELLATREDLRNAVQDLAASNEELQATNEESMSMNEELQSANEELEATSEELRSLNEELRAVNNHLRDKVDELQQSNDDLTNFFASTELATVFLDESLRLRRYTPAAAKLLDLKPEDRGRLVTELPCAVLHANLVEEAREVLDNFTVMSRELQLPPERWLTRRVLPYRTDNRRVAGVVVAFIDVTELKRTSERLGIRERQQAVVARLGLGALRTQGLGDLLQGAVSELQVSFEVDFVGVFELDLEGEELVLKAGAGWPEGFVEGQSVAVTASSHVGKVLASGLPQVFTNLRDEGQLGGSMALAGLGIVSGACCPIQDEGDSNAYGVLSLYWRHQRPFAPDDLHFVQSVTNVVGNAIRRLRIANRAAVERNVTQVLATSADLDEATEPLLEVLGASVGAGLGELWLPNEHEVALRCARRQGLGAGASSEFAYDGGPTRVAKGEGMVGAVWAQVRSRWAPADAPGLHASGMSTAVRSVCGLPIVAGKTFIGVLMFYSTETVFPDPGFLRTLDALGRSIGDFVRRTRAEAEQARLAALVGSSSDAIISKDLSGVILSWNGGAERLYGYTAQEAIGRTAEIIYPEAQRGELQDILTKIAAGKLVSHYETVRCRKDGSLLDVSVTISPVITPDGKVIGASAITRDVSDRKRTEARLREADRQKDQFLAMLGHELRNPLAAISTAVELMKHTSPNGLEYSARARTIIERQSGHMARLLDGLLDVSRMVSGKITLESQVVDLVHLLNDTLGDRARLVEERRLLLVPDLPAGPLWVWGDPVRLVQVFDNLLANAIKFTPAGGTVRVALELEDNDGWVVVRVADTGTGIDAELLPHIFEPFRQAQQSLARSSGGLGLGLALVKGLVELHGGTVVAESDGAGRGTTFSVRLPLSEHRVVTPAPVLPADQSARILVIEDDHDTADAMRDILVLEGYDASVAYDGESAVALAARLQPHLVLCDIGLPGGMTGYDVARRMRELSELETAYLVALTGYGAPEDVARANQAGFDAHVTKPIEIETITRLLSELRRGTRRRGGEGDLGGLRGEGVGLK